MKNMLHNFTIRDKDIFENQVESFKQYPSTYRNPCRDTIVATLNNAQYFIQFSKSETQTDPNAIN
jgi:hypothetical protein